MRKEGEIYEYREKDRCRVPVLVRRLFAIAAIKMIFIDIPKGKKSQEEAVYVGRGEYDPANDGKQSLSAVR